VGESGKGGGGRDAGAITKVITRVIVRRSDRAHLARQPKGPANERHSEGAGKWNTRASRARGGARGWERKGERKDKGKRSEIGTRKSLDGVDTVESKGCRAFGCRPGNLRSATFTSFSRGGSPSSSTVRCTAGFRNVGCVWPHTCTCTRGVCSLRRLACDMRRC